jgi:uncharacterized membrane protein
MAGIGFELRRHLEKESFTDLLRAYVAAGVIGSGPWVVSIGAMLLVGVFSRRFTAGAGADSERIVTTFLATVTHLMASSLVVSGAVQLLFTRFVADRLYEKKDRNVAPNVVGALVLTLVGAGALAAIVTTFAFERGDRAFRLLIVVAFAELCAVWLLSVFLSGMKAYRAVLLFFVAGYALATIAAIALARFGLAGYLAGFCLGHSVILFAMLVKVLRQYPSHRFIAWDFLDRRFIHPELAVTGVLFNIGVWADKLVFWWSPVTSEQLVGPIRYSVAYDVPIFVAYLSLIPGMAVLFVRIETDFAESYERYFRAVCDGAPLSRIRHHRIDLVSAARAAVHDIFRVQGIVAAVLLLLAPQALAVFGIPAFYATLFRVDVVAVSFQVVLLGIFTVLFYLDYRRLVLALTALFAVSNLLLSLASVRLGPRFYGFGFAAAAAIVSLVSLGALSRKLLRLDYETFMR